MEGDDGLGLGSQSRQFLIFRVDWSLVFGYSIITSSLPVWLIRIVQVLVYKMACFIPYAKSQI